jgi:hypothetical protein
VPATRIMQILSHPAALDAFESLSRGSDPKGVLAGIAADLAAQHVRELLGAPEKKEKVPARPRAKGTAGGADVIDAEFKVINVTPKK